MKKHKDSYQRLIELVIVVMISTMIGMFSGGATIFTMMNDKEIEREKCEAIKNDDVNEIVNIYEEIVNNYYKDVDKQVLIDGAINGMLSTLEDPNSSYIDAKNFTSFNDRMIGEYRGVGMEILNDTTTGYILVVNVIEDSPAERAAIKVGDLIKSVDDVSVKDKEAVTVSNLIKYGENDSVKLEIERDSKTVTKTVVKETVVLKSILKSTFTKSNKKIGYIKITIFAGNTFSQFEAALKELEKENIDSLVIDVRNNTGGYLSSVSNILELFLEKGKTMYQLQTKTNTTKSVDDTSSHRNYPISILTNEYSASASEILAAGLNESYGATIVGTSSYGKGTVQETLNVDGGGMAKITTKKWLTPNGTWIDGVGVTPTEIVELDEAYTENPKNETDNQLQKALNLIANK